MKARFDSEALADRARELEGLGLNGLRLAFVELLPAGAPDHAVLDLEFHNDIAVADIDTAVNVDGVPPGDIFEIRGGTRVRAGSGAGQVRVTAVAAGAGARTLELTVAPIGDYSTYTLLAAFADAGGDALIDPLFGALEFKFRPGCFNLECAPRREPYRAAPPHPVIDYLARDFDSFKHVLINAMRERVPGWQPTSEADLDQVIIDLLAADADELADFQDRVAAEAYLGTARKRVSVARHARLMDYHVHHGNQASTWLALEVANRIDLPDTAGGDFVVWTGDEWQKPDAAIFALPRRRDAEAEGLPPAAVDAARWRRRCYPELNTLDIYTWGDTLLSLDEGSSEADLTLPGGMSETEAEALRQLFMGEHPDQATGPGEQDVATGVDRLVIEETLNPETGTANGRDTGARQMLRLLPLDAVPPRAETLEDPATGQWMLRVRWLAEDALARRYCVVTRCEDAGVVGQVSRLHGNLARLTHGRPHRCVFQPPGSDPGVDDAVPLRRLDHRYAEPGRWGLLCELPRAPLAWQATPPGGDVPVASTAEVRVTGFAEPWREQSDLIESRADDQHFMVEADEDGGSRLRFGNGVNGMPPDAEADITVDYQVGLGSAGNVGADTLVGYDAALVDLERAWNPFDVTDGREPEPVPQVLRRATEAYRARQRRAVTLEDYAEQAELLAGVSHARARYRWTGSWRTVQVAIDPAGRDVLDEVTRRRVHRHLDALRLIGEDLEIRPAEYVALDVVLTVCAHPDYWPEDLEVELAEAFGDGYTADGRAAFFHPDRWTFGQPLHASQVIGRALSVTGVERVLRLSMRRFDPGAGGGVTVIVAPEDLPEALVDKVEVQGFEVVRVANDPDHLERGRIRFDIRGGRR